MIAALLTDTTLTLPDLADLTDRQIHCLYYHPRDKEGRVIPRQDSIPRAPTREEVRTPEEAARIHFAIGASLGVPREKLEEAWLKKYPTIPEGV